MQSASGRAESVCGWRSIKTRVPSADHVYCYYRTRVYIYTYIIYRYARIHAYIHRLRSAAARGGDGGERQDEIRTASEEKKKNNTTERAKFDWRAEFAPRRKETRTRPVFAYIGSRVQTLYCIWALVTVYTPTQYRLLLYFTRIYMCVCVYTHSPGVSRTLHAGACRTYVSCAPRGVLLNYSQRLSRTDVLFIYFFYFLAFSSFFFFFLPCTPTTLAPEPTAKTRYTPAPPIGTPRPSRTFCKTRPVPHDRSKVSGGNARAVGVGCPGSSYGRKKSVAILCALLAQGSE